MPLQALEEDEQEAIPSNRFEQKPGGVQGDSGSSDESGTTTKKM